MNLKTLSLGLVLAALAAPRPASAAVTVQGWWHFDTTGNPVDSSGNGRNYQNGFVVPGTAPGPVVSSDAAGGPLGSSGYTSTHSLRIGTSGDSDTFWNTGYVPPASNYVVEIWIKPQDKGGVWQQTQNAWIFSSGGFNCCTGPSGGECVRIENNSFPDGSAGIAAGIIVGQDSSLVVDFSPLIPVDTNRWMHLALVNLDGVVMFYTNGVPCATNTVATPTAPAGVMHLGTDGAYDAFDGFMDEERVLTFTNSNQFSVTDLLYTASPRIVTQPATVGVWSNSAVTVQVNVSSDPCDTYQWFLFGTNLVGGATSADFYLNPIATTNQVYDCLLTNSCTGAPGLATASATIQVVPVQTANVNAYRSAVTSEPSLVSYYPVDGDAGGTLTDTKGGVNGTFQGDARFDGQTNRAFGSRSVFIKDGGGSVQIPENAAFQFNGGDGTVEALIYLTSPVIPIPNRYSTIFSVASADGGSIRYQFAAAVDGGSLVCTNDAGVFLRWPVPVNLLNRFAHVALVFSGGTSVTAYVDGNSLGTQSQSGFGTANQPAWIGAPTPYYGTVDELAIYSGALSADTIAVHNSKFLFGTNTTAPSIVSQPGSKTLLAGGSPVLTVSVAGTPPLTYGWSSNGVPIAGANSASLALRDSTTSFSATYTLNVTNLYGHTNTQPIVLNFVTAPGGGYAGAVMADDPVSFWQLAESSGPTAVDSAGLNDGTYNASGVTYNAGGPPGDPTSGAKFNGSSGRVVVPFSPTLNPAGPFTVEFWASSAAGVNQGPISSTPTSLSGGYGFYYARNFNGYEMFTAAGGALTMDTGSGNRPPIGQWTHVAGVCDGSNNIYLYVNGYLVGTANNVGTPFAANPSAVFYIGCRRDSTLFYNGSVGDVAFYNYELTQAQIQRHVSIGLPLQLAIGPSTNVVADTKPAEPPYDGLNNGATWLASDSDGTTTRNGVMSFNATNSTGQITDFGWDGLDTTNGTIMFWMRSAGTDPASGNEGAIIFDWRSTSGLAIVQHDAGTVFVQAQNNFNHFDSVANVSDGKWHQVAITYDQGASGFVTNYIDGTYDSSALNSQAWAWPAGQVMEFGRDTRYDGGYWEFYNGSLDDFRMYNRILTPAEISAAHGGSLVDTNALVLRFNFDNPPDGNAVTWPYGSLQSAPVVNGSFNTLSNITSPFPVAPHPDVQKYFRGQK